MDPNGRFFVNLAVNLSSDWDSCTGKRGRNPKFSSMKKLEGQCDFVKVWKGKKRDLNGGTAFMQCRLGPTRFGTIKIDFGTNQGGEEILCLLNPHAPTKYRII